MAPYIEHDDEPSNSLAVRLTELGPGQCPARGKMPVTGIHKTTPRHRAVGLPASDGKQVRKVTCGR